MLSHLGKTDIYLLDQIMKNRITKEMRILDAGCGSGRNSLFFVGQKMEIHGIDRKPEHIIGLQNHLATAFPDYPSERFSVADLSNIPFPDEYFDFIISSAVLHFCNSRAHFIQLMEEMIRVLSPHGILWFRMTTKHTIEQLSTAIEGDIYLLPDGSRRYLLDRKVLEELMLKHNLVFLDPFKTVNVSDIRTMATVALSRRV